MRESSPAELLNRLIFFKLHYILIELNRPDFQRSLLQSRENIPLLISLDLKQFIHPQIELLDDLNVIFLLQFEQV